MLLIEGLADGVRDTDPERDGGGDPDCEALWLSEEEPDAEPVAVCERVGLPEKL